MTQPTKCDRCGIPDCDLFYMWRLDQHVCDDCEGEAWEILEEIDRRNYFYEDLEAMERWSE